MCVDVYGDVQIPHSQRLEGGKYGTGGAITTSVRDWNGVLKLKSALGKGILFTKNADHQNIEVYTDANWDDRCDISNRRLSLWENFLGGHPFWNYSKSSMLNFGVPKTELPKRRYILLV